MFYKHMMGIQNLRRKTQWLLMLHLWIYTVLQLVQ